MREETKMSERKQDAERYKAEHPRPMRVRKTAIVDALRWTGSNLRAVINFTGGRHESAKKWTWAEYEQIVRIDGLKIFTLEGPLRAEVDDVIMKGPEGECYPCKPGIFKRTYEEV